MEGQPHGKYAVCFMLDGKSRFRTVGDDGVPIFILSRNEPDPRTTTWPLITYVDGVARAMTQAKKAAGTGTCWSAGRESRSSHSPPAFWMRSSCG